MELIESDKILTIFLFFIDLYLNKKSPLVQLNNYQLFDCLLSLELRSHMLETNNHFTPEPVF